VGQFLLTTDRPSSTKVVGRRKGKKEPKEKAFSFVAHA